MQASFNLTRGDFIALLLVQNRQDTTRAFVLPRVVLPALLGLFGLSCLFIAITNHILQCYGIALFWFALALLPFASDEFEWRLWLKRRNFDSEVEVELRSEGVGVYDGTGESLWPWGSITEVRGTPNHIVLLRTKGRGTIIPRNAFASHSEAEQFLQLAETLWREANPTQKLPPVDAPPLASPR